MRLIRSPYYILRFLALLPFCLVPGLLADDPKSDSGKLSTQYFRLHPSVWTTAADAEGLLPIIPDGLENDELTRTRDAEPYLTRRGVAFPAGAAAVLYESAGILEIKSTGENLQRVSKLFQHESLKPPMLVRGEMRVVEFQPADEGQLAGMLTFAALQAKLGDRLKVIAASSLVTKSLNRVSGELDGAAKRPAGSEKKEDEEDTWPPPPNVERANVEFEPTIQGFGAIDVNGFVQYARPAKGELPAIVTSFRMETSFRDGSICKVRTFTLTDPKSETPRYIAVLFRFALVDDLGRTADEIREFLHRPPAKLPAPEPTPR